MRNNKDAQNNSGVWNRNKFFISEKAQERLRDYLNSSHVYMPKHNINNYWLRRCEVLNYTFHNGWIEIREDSNLAARMYWKIIPGQYSNLRKAILARMAGALSILPEWIGGMRHIVDQKIQEGRWRDICHLILTGKRKLYFPFGLWNGNPDLLRQEPFFGVIKSWPLRSAYMLRAMDVINHYKKLGDNLRVIEIGSGPAILCGFMTHKFGTKHVLIDLPEQIAVGFAFLSEFFPEKKILLPHEIDTHKFRGAETDIIFITPEQLNILKDSKFDVGVNIFSFQEMSYKTIDEYFALLRSCMNPDGVFYCMNRIDKWNKYDGTLCEFAKYPWREKDEILSDASFDGYVAGAKLCPRPYREKLIKFK